MIARLLAGFLAALWAAGAAGQTFTNLGAAPDADPKIAPDASYTLNTFGELCGVRNTSTGVLETWDPPGSMLDCADIVPFSSAPGYSIVANTTGLCGVGTECAWRIVNVQGTPAWGPLNTYDGTVAAISESSSFPLGLPFFVGTNTLGQGTAESTNTLPNSPPLVSNPIEEGAFLGIAQDGSWAIGRQVNAGLQVFRPMLWQPNDATALTLLTFDTFRQGWPNDVASVTGPLGGFIAVGEAQRETCGGDPIVCTVELEGIRWVGIEDTPDVLRSRGPGRFLTRAVATNGDATITGGESGGHAVIWEGSSGYTSPTDLNTLMIPLVPSGWVLTKVTDVAEEDDVFVGLGTNNGAPAAWLIDMEGTPVPEPGLLAGLLPSIALLIFLAGPAMGTEEAEKTLRDVCDEMEDPADRELCHDLLDEAREEA